MQIQILLGSLGWEGDLGKSRCSGQQPSLMETWNAIWLLAWLCSTPHASSPGQPIHCPLSIPRCHQPTILSSSSLLLRTSAHGLCVLRGLYLSPDCWLTLFVLLSKSWKVKEWLGCPVTTLYRVAYWGLESTHFIESLWIRWLIQLSYITYFYSSSPIPGHITSAQQTHKALGRSCGYCGHCGFSEEDSVTQSVIAWSFQLPWRKTKQGREWM